MNALAGGGTFATMPTLIALGLPSPTANATSNVALQPGAMTAAWGYRRDLRPVGGLQVRTMAGITFAGGLVGSLLLVVTPTSLFDMLIPWLLLTAFVAIAAGPALSLRLGFGDGRPRLLAGVQAVLGVYGGYFGGGIGMMITAAWGLFAGEPPHRLMAPRTLMLAIANAAATIIFVAFGMISWTLVAPMLIGAVAGGYGGARLGRRLSPAVVRAITLVLTGVTTMMFFQRAYFPQ